jgi:hypothetical protein
MARSAIIARSGMYFKNSCTESNSLSGQMATRPPPVR